MSSDHLRNTIFVRNLPSAASRADLDAHFAGIGPLRHVVVVTQPGTNVCKGFGFVTYALPDDAAVALKSLHGSYIRGRRLSLDIARKRQRGEEQDFENATQRTRYTKNVVKVKGAKKGSLGMRTVLLSRTDGGHLTEQSACEAVRADAPESGFESCVLSADGCEARCTFSSWALAGKAAAAAHGNQIQANIEALKGGRRTRLIVRNLPFLVDQVQLRQQFELIAPVREVSLAPADILKTADRPGKPSLNASKESMGTDASGEQAALGHKKDTAVRCGGYAFVEYFLVADAKFAVQKLNGSKFGGRIVAVDLAIGKSAYDAQDRGIESDEDRVAPSTGGEVISPKDPGNDDSEESGDTSDTETIEVDQQSRSPDDDASFPHSSDKDCSTKPTLPCENKEALSTEEELARTVFVRNLLFETSAPELWRAMEEEFGRVEQAVLVLHPITKRPRGTAFVRFASVASAQRAVTLAGEGDTSEAKGALGLRSTGFTLQGRPLMIATAVDRSKAREFCDGKSGKKIADRRNLRLAWVGMVKPNSQEARGLSEQDLTRRAKAAKEKKVKLERNPNTFVSDVRLSVRNLPRELDEKIVKHMFLLAAREEKRHRSERVGVDTGRGVEDPSTREASYCPGAQEPRVSNIVIVRDSQRNNRSKGYGFVQFERHEDALRALNLLNNNPSAMEWLIKQKPKALQIDSHRERLLRKQWGMARRLIVEFSVEDRRKLQLIQRIREKGKMLAEEQKRKHADGENKETKEKKIGKRRRLAREGNEDNLKDDKTSMREPSKSDKRAAKKRERAKTSEVTVRKRAREEDDCTEGRFGKHRTQGYASWGREALGSRSAVNELRVQKESDRYGEAARPAMKPKKPKKKRSLDEMKQDAKFEGLVGAYKRKLLRTGKGVGHAVRGEQDTRQSLSTGPRWFD